MDNSDNKNSSQKFQRSELLTDQEIHARLKEAFWTARTAAYTVLGLKIPNLESLEEEKRFFPDFETYYDLFEKCFRKRQNCSTMFVLRKRENGLRRNARGLAQAHSQRTVDR